MPRSALIAPPHPTGLMPETAIWSPPICERDLKTHKVRVLLYNKQASDRLVQHLVEIARTSNIPVVGVTETCAPDTSYQDWMLNDGCAEHINRLGALQQTSPSCRRAGTRAAGNSIATEPML